MDGGLRRDPPAGGDAALIEDVFRHEWGRALATLIGLLGDFELAEESLQEAVVTAAERWPRDGVPDRPGAWLIATARNRAIDRIRRDRARDRATRRLDPLTPLTTTDPDPDEGGAIADERLELIFMCCHPALATDAQVALTLRAVGALSTEQIARAFLVAEETMKRRLTRAKTKITATAIPFTLPADHVLVDRIAAVLAVVYLIFNQGYSHPVPDPDLAAEAIVLGGALGELMPDEPEVHGLRALMLLHHARREARFDGDRLILLPDQDRRRWDSSELAAGRAALDRAIALHGRGPYVLQAAIASVQADETPDWDEVASLYERLHTLTRSPVVALNRAAAIAQAGRVGEALALADALAPQLDAYQYLHATRAELLRRLGRRDDARAAYARALELAVAPAERRFLEDRLAGH